MGRSSPLTKDRTAFSQSLKLELSQSELAEQSGIKVRNIQMYEQRVNNIDKAQVQTLYKLSRVLGCDIEDLLENPMM